VVFGGKKVCVGSGTGKANDVPDATKKAIKGAKRSLVKYHLLEQQFHLKPWGALGQVEW
jgi:ribosomal protein S5